MEANFSEKDMYTNDREAGSENVKIIRNYLQMDGTKRSCFKKE